MNQRIGTVQIAVMRPFRMATTPIISSTDACIIRMKTTATITVL